MADAGRNKDKKNLRMLPPGTFSDYLNLLRNRYPSNRISLKLFCKALGDLSVNIFFLVLSVEIKTWNLADLQHGIGHFQKHMF